MPPLFHSQALQRVKDEEEELANKIAYETREELKKEEEDLLEAKSKLKTFLLSNEVRSEASGIIWGCSPLSSYFFLRLLKFILS